MAGAESESAPLLVETAEPHAQQGSIPGVDGDGDDEAIPVSKKLAFAMSSPPSSLTHTAIGFQLNLFLLQVVRLQPRTVGSIVLVGRVWDGVWDPVVGVMTTRTRTRWGSLKPWIAGSVLPVATSYLALWSAPPWWDESARAGYVLTAYLLFLLAISMYHTPYTAMTMHLSRRQADINSGTMYRMCGEAIAVLLSAILGVLIDPFDKASARECGDSTNGFCAFSSFQLGFIAQAAIISFVCCLCSIGILTGVSEQKLPPGTTAPPDSVATGFYKVFSTRSFRTLTLMSLWIWMAVNMLQANALLFAEIVLGLEYAEATLLSLTLLIFTVGTVPVWYIATVVLGKKKTFILGSIVLVVVVLGMWGLTEDTPLWQVYVAFAAFGTAIGSVYLVPALMIPDVINEAAVRDNGVRREALFYSYSVFVQKLGGGMAIYISNVCLERFGNYNSEEDDHSEAKGILRVLNSPVPAVLAFISFLCAFLYPLTPEEERRVESELKQVLESRALAAGEAERPARASGADARKAGAPNATRDPPQDHMGARPVS